MSDTILVRKIFVCKKGNDVPLHLHTRDGIGSHIVQDEVFEVCIFHRRLFFVHGKQIKCCVFSLTYPN